MPARRRRVIRALLVAAVALVPGCTDRDSPTSTAHGAGATVIEISLGVPRAVHRATTLTDGRVLFTGGCTTPGCGGVDSGARSALFDAASKITAGPSLHQPRLSHTATALDDGRVLVVGGYPGEGRPPTGSIELFDPRTDSFTTLGSLATARADHTASLLSDGQVLIAGGRGVHGALDSVEMIDPTSGRTVDAPALPQPRSAQVAVTFDGGVLLVGGTTVSDRAVATTVRHDSVTGRWGPGPTLDRARVKHAAVSLPGGGVLVIGGSGSAESRVGFADTEVLGPGDDHFRPGPRLPEGRYKLTDATAALPDGRVAVAGGDSVVVIDPATSVVRVLTPSLGTARAFQTLNVVSDDRVLVAGGYDGTVVPSASAWLVGLG